MNKINFDVNKIKMVNISLVKPNPWNPKDKQREEFQKVKKSVETNGLRSPIVVRNKGEYYEIIDGEQRYTACLELGFENIIIYDEGDLDDKTAKELTVWYQQQVPFNDLELSELIKDLSVDYSFKDLNLPYNEEELMNYINLTNFEFKDYAETLPEPIEEKKEVLCPNCGHKIS